jgi:hypothetical protein
MCTRCRSGAPARVVAWQHGELVQLELTLSFLVSATSSSMMNRKRSASEGVDDDADEVNRKALQNERAKRARVKKKEQQRGGGLKVPKSSEHWVVVGVWLASRHFPDVPFFLQLWDNNTGRRLDLPVPYKSLVRAMSPKYNEPDRIPLHLRVVQRLNWQRKLLGEVRYLCTDIAASYQIDNEAFKWIIFQSVALHASPRMCLCSAAAC